MKYYVYTLARPDGTVFYVGKGCGNRVAQHEQEALRGHNCPKCELIRLIWRDGGTVQRAIVFETDDQRAALDHEAMQIKQYGPAQLVNRNHRGSRSGLPRWVTRGAQVRDELAAQLEINSSKRIDI